MFKNKHIIAALIITPILAIIAYFATDYIVSEKPHKALPGASYQLAEKPNCRYNSGRCGLKNADFTADITVKHLDEGYLNLTLKSAFPLQGVKLAMVDNPEQSGEPRAMKMQDQQGTEWTITLSKPRTDTSRIRLAMASGKSMYYGDTSTAFLVYETSFEKDFRKAGGQ
jgi:hypothetical protein